MAVDAFLKIDGVEGESSDQKHKNEIEVLSYSWGVDQTGAKGFGGGGGEGKAVFQDFQFVAHTTKASPKLFLACASGQHFKSAILTVRKAGKDQQEFLKVSLEDVLVTEFNNAGEASEVSVPTDQFSVNFAKIDFLVRSQNEDGSLGDESRAAWDVNRNVKL